MRMKMVFTERRKTSVAWRWLPGCPEYALLGVQGAMACRW